MRKTVLSLFPLGLALAQHQMAPQPEKPVTLLAGLGIWRHPIQTKDAEAQKYFDQGLTLLYGFNRYESLRSFRKASELDPGAAMAFWGMAMAQGPYINMDGDPTFDQKASCAAVEAGLKITTAPARERAYLEAAATRCPEERPQAYVDSMRALAARFPDDLDAATLFAESLMVPVRWHWYTSDGTPAAGMAEAERTLEGVLRRWPDHPGANHYYIHAVESSRTPERGIPSAQRLMGVVPEAGHIVHMPGHIWLAVGDFEMAAVVNERAAEVDRQYFAATNVTAGSYGMYYAHNLHFIAYARWMQGRGADGIRAANTLAAVMAPMAEAMPEMVDSFQAVTVFGRVRFGSWEAILQLRPPSDKMPLTSATFRYARCLALQASGDHAGALREQGAFEIFRARATPDAMWGNNRAAPVLAVASEVLAARVATSAPEALPHWEHAVAMQDALVYDEPPAWYYPVRESWGAALLRAGKAAEAETIFREGLKRSPRNGRILFGLMESLRAQGKTEAADRVQKEFEASWAKADVKLSMAEM
jgi:tetratricopeptide (TPR) repeat protein